MTPKIGADQIFTQCLGLETVPQFQESFRAFIHTSNTNKWMISSDYCLHNAERPNDVFAFSIFPYNKELEKIQKEIKEALPTDIKNTRSISQIGIETLRDRGRYHFCFIVNPARTFIGDLSSAKLFLDNSIKTARAWNDAHHKMEFIKGLEALRREADSKSFKVSLLEDITLSCVFVGFIASMLVKYSEPEIIGWFSDRDSITTAWSKVSHLIAAINYSAFCQQQGYAEKVRGTKFIVGGPDMSGAREHMWFEELVRIPDYFAGSLATYDITNNAINSNQEKHAVVINQAIGTNPNIQILRFVINPESIQMGKVILLPHSNSSN